MVWNHRKPLKAMVATSKTIVKPLMTMVRPPKKHSMVMVIWIPKKHWTCQWSSQINILLKQLNYPVVTITILIWLCCSKVYCLFWLMRSAQNLCFVVNRFYALFRLDGSPKSSLTSKPLLTLPSKFWKPSKNHWFQWLDPPKNIQWWWSNFVKTIEKPLTAMVP